MVGEYRGTEGFKGLNHGWRRSKLLPNILTRRRIQGEDVTRHIFAGSSFREALKLKSFISLKHLDVELAAIESRAAAVSPLRGEGSVGFFDVELPKLLAIQIKARDHGICEKKDHLLAIGDRRWAGEIALVIPLKSAL